jgi:transposase
MEKKTLPENLAAELKPEQVRQRKVRLCFQDEARFGRMVRFRRCWAPSPLRPKVCNGYERQFTYVYGSVSPLEGQLDWCLSSKMNTAQMQAFLQQVSAAHPEDFILMIVDGASSHKSKDLVVPENVRLIALPPYAPELNPQEHVWDEVREKGFPNRVSADMERVVAQLKQTLGELSADTQRIRSLTAWPWIVSLTLTVK